MPNPKQMNKLAREREQPKPALDACRPPNGGKVCCWTRAAAGRPWLPIEQRRLSEVPRHLLRVECLRCLRVVVIQKADAVRLYGPHAVFKDVGQTLLEYGCEVRTGSRDDDGCWPNWVR
jgi:hypothetical protein